MGSTLIDDRMGAPRFGPPWPSIAVITPGDCSLEQLVVRTSRLYAQGMRMLVLREPKLQVQAQRTLSLELKQACPELCLVHHLKCPGTRALLGDGASRVHLPACVQADEFRRLALHGVSVHSEQELARAMGGGASYAMLAPVWAPNSKPGDTRATLGPQGYEELLAQSSIPLYALGGVDATRVARWKGRRDVRVALIGELFTAPEERALRAFAGLCELLGS